MSVYYLYYTRSKLRLGKATVTFSSTPVHSVFFGRIFTLNIFLYWGLYGLFTVIKVMKVSTSLIRAINFSSYCAVLDVTIGNNDD